MLQRETNPVRRICILAVLTAMYVVLSAFLKITLIGNIQLDLGYIAFAVALSFFNVWGAVVGILGCMLESILFSAYGFSISWAVANAIIGIGCGFAFRRSGKIWLRAVCILIFAAIGLLVAKTGIECALYAIPLVVKIPKNAVAFALDTAVMCVGLGFAEGLKRRLRHQR